MHFDKCEKSWNICIKICSENAAENILELEPGQQGVVVRELQEATARAASMEFVSHPSPASLPAHASRPPLPPTLKMELEPKPKPLQSQNPPSVRQAPPSSPHLAQSALNPLLLNPFIASQSMFPDSQTYQEYLRVQEQQIKVAMDHFRLQLSMGDRSKVLTDLISPGYLPVPPQNTPLSSSSFPQPATAQHFKFPKSSSPQSTSSTSTNQMPVQVQAKPRQPTPSAAPSQPPPSIHRAIETINQNQQSQPHPVYAPPERQKIQKSLSKFVFIRYLRQYYSWPLRWIKILKIQKLQNCYKTHLSNFGISWDIVQNPKVFWHNNWA